MGVIIGMQKKKLDQIVYEDIVRQIENGELLVREHVTEQQVADALEISRTPVRKAFDRLVNDNYLENIENVGVRVKMQELSDTDFQDRMDLFERLINHYLFDVEKKETAFETEHLETFVDNMQECIESDAYAFENIELEYWTEMLKYSENQYAKKIMLDTLKECFFNEGHIHETMKNSQSLKVKHFVQLTEYLEDSNYPSARREIRILLNQLKLNILEKGKFY